MSFFKWSKTLPAETYMYKLLKNAKNGGGAHGSEKSGFGTAPFQKLLKFEDLKIFLRVLRTPNFTQITLKTFLLSCGKFFWYRI